ncbi:hypothetical protein ACFQ0M_34635 [Kitasatospora aburaviensis]
MARRHLVYVLPGIGGSVLERPGTGKRSGEAVWDAGLVDVAGLLTRPDRLSVDQPLRPTGVIRSRRLLPGWTVVPGYERLIDALGALPDVRLDKETPTGATRQPTWSSSRTTSASVSPTPPRSWPQTCTNA